MAPILGYWNIRGMGEPIRYLLHYAGVKFEDKRYTFANREEWSNDKFRLGLDFPNLPYYIDDKVKLTQSTTILRYLAQKHNLAGSTEEEQTKLELVEQQIIDFRLSFILLIINPDFQKEKLEFQKKVLVHLQMLSDFLGGKKWFGGENISYVDFIAYEALDYHWLFIPDLMKDFPGMKQYIERFEKLPALQNYFRSDAYKRWPIFIPLAANFGGTGEEPKRE